MSENLGFMFKANNLLNFKSLLSFYYCSFIITLLNYTNIGYGITET